MDTDPADGQVETAGGARQKLYLHVGLPKTGTSFLQAALRDNRDALAEAGFSYPRPYPGATFHAMVEMTHSYARWGQDPEKVAGTFEKILSEGRDSGHTVIVSHEGFGRAGSASLERIRDHLEGFEVHVVVTVRDLGRTITALWQEGVKNGILDTFEEFTDRTLAMAREGRADDNGFLLGQNVEHTLRRWGAVAPPERTHVVVCPPSGAPRDELWNRFAAALGIPAGVVDPLAVERANESLGAPQVALLRQVNASLGDRIAEPWRNKVVKRWFANGLLSRIDSGRISTPAHLAAELAPIAERWREAVVAGGHPTYGDLDDLALQVAAPGQPDPDVTSVEEMYVGVPDLLADLLVRIRDQNVMRREQKQESAARIAELRKSLTAAERRLVATERRLAEAQAQLEEHASRTGVLGRLRRRD